MLGTMSLLRVLGPVAAVLAVAACSSSTGGTAVGPPTHSDPAAPTTVSSPPTTAPVSTPPPPPDSGAPSSPTIAPPTTPLRTVTVRNADGTSLLVSIWAQKSDPTCVDHAYGAAVIAYLTKYPCSGLQRTLATTTVGGRAVGMAISDLGFRGTSPSVYRTVGDFITLVKQDGTGNLDDLLRDGYRMPAGPTAVPDVDAFSALGQDAGLEIVDAWYLDGPTPPNDPTLLAMEQSLFLQLA